MLVNFREYILKIALIPEAFFQPKMHQIAFCGRAQPGTAGGTYSTPQTPSWTKGSLLLREEDGKKVKEGEGDRVEGEGREEKGK